MDRAEIIAETKKQRKKTSCSVSAFFFYLAGVFGYLLFLKGMPGISFEERVVYPVVFLFCLILWLLFRWQRRLVVWFLFLTAAVTGIVLFSQRLWLPEQFDYLGELFESYYWNSYLPQKFVSLTLTAAPAALVFSLLLFFLEFGCGSHGILCVLTMALLISCPFLELSPRPGALALLILYQAGLLVWQGTEPGAFQSSFRGAGQRGLSNSSGIIFCVIAGMVFLLAFQIVEKNDFRFYRSADHVDGFLNRIVQSLNRTEKEQDPGKVSKNNNYLTGEERVYVYLNQDFANIRPLYLKNFTGGAYTDGEWSDADEAEKLLNAQNHADIFDQMRFQFYGTEPLNELYYWTARLTNPQPEENGRPDESAGEDPQLWILPLTREESQPVPYNGLMIGRFLGDPARDSLSYSGTQYAYRDWRDLTVNWEWEEEADRELGQEIALYRQLQQRYQQEIQSVYTAVPRQQLPRLARLAEETPLESLEEITTFIIYTLQSNASYTLTPGLSAGGGDVVERFLFEKKAGYCQHFAAAATLMYRLYGIPARYASGYLVKPDEFRNLTGDQKPSYEIDDRYDYHTSRYQGSGNSLGYLGQFLPEREDLNYADYYAAITDRSAHAWAEIFIEDYGWVPIEVTPGNPDSAFTDGPASEEIYPSFTKADMKAIMEEKGWDLSVPGLGGQNAAQTEAPEITPPAQTAVPNGADKNEKPLTFSLPKQGLPLAAGCYAVCILMILAELRRYRKLRRMDRWSCRKSFAMLLEALHQGGVLLEKDGTEADFAKNLWQTLPVFTWEQADWFVKTAWEEAYGNVTHGGEARKTMQRLYLKGACAVCGKLGLWGRLWFRYGKGYC